MNLKEMHLNVHQSIFPYRNKMSINTYFNEISEYQRKEIDQKFYCLDSFEYSLLLFTGYDEDLKMINIFYDLTMEDIARFKSKKEFFDKIVFDLPIKQDNRKRNKI
jgi:hypothetical protein